MTESALSLSFLQSTRVELLSVASLLGTQAKTDAV